MIVTDGDIRCGARRAPAAAGRDGPGPPPVGRGAGDGLVLLEHSRATVNGYIGKLAEETADLEKVLELSGEVEDDFLDSSIGFNLATAHMRCGNTEAARDQCKRLESSIKALDYPKGQYELDHLKGNIKEAKGDYGSAQKLYVRAHEGFVQVEERHSTAFAGFDLCLLHSREGNQEEALRLVRDLIAILDSLKLHPETLAAVRVLAKALADMKITNELLRGVREKLRKDPLVQLS